MTKSLIFPGQGSQYSNMGKYLFDNFKVAKDVFEEVNSALNFDLTKIIFSEDSKSLNMTENTQPAIMAVSIATFRVLEKDKGIKVSDFKYVAGHSLGEYSALVASNCISLSDASKILKKRGQAMQTAVKVGDGAMAAVLNVEYDEIKKILKELKYNTVEISNDNCPGQCVVSGITIEVDNFVKKLKTDYKKKSITLPVSAPFHCALMKPAAEELSHFIDSINFNDLSIPIISNVSVKPESDPNQIKKLLVDCVFKTVRWREIINFMLNDGIVKYVECGPGKALTNMLKRFNSDIIATLKTDTLEDIKSYE
jgi:[acyl-carrier-protein] S-malonyltransferase